MGHQAAFPATETGRISWCAFIIWVTVVTPLDVVAVAITLRVKFHAGGDPVFSTQLPVVHGEAVGSKVPAVPFEQIETLL